MMNFMNIKVNTVKSICIITYFLFVICAAIVNLGGYSLAYLTYPWFGYGMFSSFGDSFHELGARGTLINGTLTPLPFENIFPMPSILIERGRGQGVSAIILDFKEPGRSRALGKLCRHVLNWHNTHVTNPTERIKDVQINLRSWPSEKESTLSKDTLLTTCS